MLKRFDIEHIRTTAYRPQHNGLVERWHRRLKDALTSAADKYAWVKRLPLIMLNLRVAVRDDGQPSPSELVYGTPLTLPGDLITPSEVHEYPRCANYSYQLREHMENIRPIVTKHHTKGGEDGSYVDPRLKTCSRVLLKHMNKHSLQKNYTGPHEIIARHDKYFTIRLPNGTSDNVTVDRLKACYTLEEALPPPVQPAYHEIMIYPHDQIGPDDLPPLSQEDPPPRVRIAEPPPVTRQHSPALIFSRQSSPVTVRFNLSSSPTSTTPVPSFTTPASTNSFI